MSAQGVAVVTGSSTGLGFETSLALARNGFHTYATMRNLEEKSPHITEKAGNENLLLQAIQLDVSYVKFELLIFTPIVGHTPLSINLDSKGL